MSVVASVGGGIGGAVSTVASGVGELAVGIGNIDIGGVVQDALLNAKIIPIDPLGTPVIFSYNPEKITWRRNASKLRLTKNEAKQDIEQWTGTGPRLLSFDAWLEGPQAYPFATQLLQMMTPDGGLLGALGAMVGLGAGGGVVKEKPATLLFQWGPVFMQGWMTKCNISYERFHISGLPLRAKCQIEITEKHSVLPATNPTSGGLPGRQQHTVVAGESLAGIATGAYGQPGQWRAVAEANGIDDPFAVRPGRAIYMPAPAELQGRRQR
jgi:nucleoid-associated protein YgaU